jgi:hypothetical protein
MLLLSSLPQRATEHAVTAWSVQAYIQCVTASFLHTMIVQTVGGTRASAGTATEPALMSYGSSNMHSGTRLSYRQLPTNNICETPCRHKAGYTGCCHGKSTAFAERAELGTGRVPTTQEAGPATSKIGQATGRSNNTSPGNKKQHNRASFVCHTCWIIEQAFLTSTPHHTDCNPQQTSRQGWQSGHDGTACKYDDASSS